MKTEVERGWRIGPALERNNMMSTIKMKAVDSLHLSEVGPDSLRPGEEFEISETFARELEERGLATRVEAKPTKPAKAQPAPKNKAEAALENKAASAD
jgi:hypothetical protein